MGNKNILLILCIIFSFTVKPQEKMVEFSIDLSAEYDDSSFSEQNKDENGFQIKGTKGFFWAPEQYYSEIPILSSYGMNFLATCYGSFYKDYKFEKGNNNWWIPFNNDLKKKWKNVIDRSI